MKSIFAETIDKVVEEVLQLGSSIIKIEEAEQPTQIAGCWETDKQGNDVIGLYLYRKIDKVTAKRSLCSGIV